MCARQITGLVLLLIFTFIYEIGSSGPDHPRHDIEVVACGPNKALNCTKFYMCAKRTEDPDEVEVFDFKAHNSVQTECEAGTECCESKPEDFWKQLPTKSRPDRNPSEFNKCGKRAPKGVQYEVKNFPNDRSQQGEFPWTIAIINETNMREVYCAGSLIHPSVVLAAAHNFVDRRGNQLDISQFILRAGEWDFGTNQDTVHQEQRIDRIVLHDFVRKPAPKDDIALLFTKMPFELGPFVRTICLPETGDTFFGEQCISAGWGSDSWGSGIRSIQKKVELSVVSQRSCINELRLTRLGHQFTLPPDTSICAKPSAGADTCDGDGGAALACLKPVSGDGISSVPANDGDEETYVQAGIVSWGIECHNGIPSVYTNVPHYREWIDTKMGNLDRASYTY